MSNQELIFSESGSAGVLLVQLLARTCPYFLPWFAGFARVATCLSSCQHFSNPKKPFYADCKPYQRDQSGLICARAVTSFHLACSVLINAAY
jgi:hypothetical protein